MSKNPKIEAPVIVPSEEISKLLLQAREKLGYKSAELTMPDLSGIVSLSLDDSDTSMRDILKKKPKAVKEILKSKLLEAKENIEKEFKKTMKNMPDILAQKAIEQLFSLLNTINIILISPYDEMISTILITYNNVVRLMRFIFDKDKTEEEKKAAKAKMFSILKTVPYIADIIALIMLIENLKLTISILENAKDSDGEQYDTTIEKYTKTKELLDEEYFKSSQIAQIILYIIKILLPLLALIGAAFNSSKEFDKKLSEETEKALANDNSLPVMKSQIDNNTENIVYYAKHNLHNFSYSYNGGNTIIKKDNIDNSSINDECYEPPIDYKNICIIDRDGVIGEEEMNNLLLPEKFIYELNTQNSNYSLNISEAQSFSIGDELGHLNNLPFKANMNGIVEKIDENKIFCKEINKPTEEILNDIQNLSSSDISSMHSDIQDMVNKFSDLSYAETVIREYLGYTIIPQIPLHNNVNGSKSTNSKDAIYKACENEIDETIDTHKQNIKIIGGKEHAQSMAQENKLLELKEEIIKEKDSFYNKIFDIWENNLSKKETFCRGNTNDYHLFSNYLNLYYKIEYDKDNKYIVELQKILTDFISTRNILETASLNDAIKELNSLCNDVLKEKWAEKQPYINSLYGFTTNVPITNKFNYYKAFEKMFQTNYYSVNNSSDSNIELNSEYKKMYDFLVGILDANDNEVMPTINIDANDVNAMLSGGTSNNKDIDTSKAKIRQKVKDICNRYTIIKNISDYKIINGQIAKNKRNNIKNELIKQTGYEYEILEKYYLKIKQIYLNNKSLYNNDAFDIFKEASIEQKQLVYYKNEKYKHFFITTDTLDIEDLYDEENKKKFDELSNYDSSPYTKIQTNDIRYWLLYCAQATLMHCILPMYWSCGFMAAGVPVPMPVIYVPIYFLKGSFSMLFGLGICGVAVWPMILCLNFSLNTKCILQSVNTIIDKIQALNNNILTMGMNGLNSSIKSQLDKVVENGKNYDEEIRKIEIDILNKKEQINIGNGIIKLRINEMKEKMKKEK